MNDLITEEILKQVMGESTTKRTPRYVSCIKIAGSPILPPLIDEIYRGQLIHYRNLAILVEKKIRDRKKLKNNRQSVDSGVMISASVSEPSCFRPYVLQSSENGESMAQCLGVSENSRNCERNCMFISDSSDEASSQNYISNEEMWKYLSNCVEGEFNVFDDQNKEFTSSLSTALTAETDRLNSMYEKSMLSRSTTHNNSNHNESLLDVDDIPVQLRKLPVEFCESMKQICNSPHENGFAERDNASHQEKENNNNNKNSINCCNEAVKSYSCDNMNSKNKDNRGNVRTLKLNSEHNFLNRCINDKTCKNPTVNSMMSEGEHGGKMDYDVSVAKVEEVTDRIGNIDYSLPVTASKETSKDDSVSLLPCDANSPQKNVPSSVYEPFLGETNSFHQGGDGDSNTDKFANCKEMHISPLKHAREKVSGIKISCSSISLPEYPDSVTTRERDKLKSIKEYNPINYGDFRSKEGTDKNCHEFTNMSGTAMKLRRQQLSDHNINNGNEESGEEQSKSNIDEPSVNLDNSSVSQKRIVDMLLSDSVSISDLDFNSSSVATLPADTPEENDEMQHCLSAYQDNELFPPKLVRQNSYTLIAPSPVLLAHAKANEKSEEKTLSEESKSKVCEKSSRKNWDRSKVKADWNAEMMKYNCGASAHKETQQNDEKRISVMKVKAKNMQKSKGLSLPGSTVTSPVKVNPDHSSLDNLPIVSVRKFQELINNKYNQNQLLSDSANSHFSLNSEFPSNKSALSCRSFSLDLNRLDHNAVQNRLRSRSKSDLQDPNMKQFLMLNVDTSIYKTDVEMARKSTSCSHAESNSSRQSKVNNVSTPKSNQSNQTDFDEFSPGFSVSTSETDIKRASKDNTEESDRSPHHTSSCPADPTAQQIFLQLQNQHSQLMAQLLDRQKKEQEALANTFLNQQRQILQEMKLIPPASDDAQFTSANSDNGSCSTEKITAPAHRENNVTDAVSVGSHLSNSIEMEHPSGNSDHSRHNGTDTFGTAEHDSNSELRIVTPPPPTPPPPPKSPRVILHVTEEQMTAASIINAAARGYLTRRLLKTDYVQEIINTISESVQCALQLQKECPVDITPSDVELHRRLIQQLTAACYSLHDTFFSLSIQEKMNVIANDRERRRTMISRPPSARSSLSVATQKYIQRKQQHLSCESRSSRQSDRPSSSARRSWWRSKGRACSAGEAPKWLPQQYPSWQYEQSASYYSKQPMVVSSKQQQCNNRVNRRPWR